MKRVPIALQLYSVRDECARDFPATLAAVAKMGYEGVELHSLYKYSPQDVRKMLDDAGLVCCGAHASWLALQGDGLAHKAESLITLGRKDLVLSGVPEERRNSAAAWSETARLVAAMAERAAPYGIRLGYHNHAVEFQSWDGKTGFDIFFSETSPSVFMQLDIGHALRGGADPVACLRRYPGRAVTVHVKEHSPDDSAMIGEGMVDWKAVFAECERQGKTEWYIVEHERYPYPPMECVRRDLDNLRRMGK